jgi:ABC-type oligopeptide transport system substrate-binding subunit
MADYPDGDNFMQLFYGKNIHMNNNGCVSLPEFDALYEHRQRLPAGEGVTRCITKWQD